MAGSLTGSPTPGESGGAAFSTVGARGQYGTTVFAMLVSSMLIGSRAGAEPPRELAARVLRRAALDGADFAGRRFAAALVPSLRLDFGVARSEAPMQSRWAVEVLARLQWPLDAISAGDARALVGPSMRRAARRDQVLEDLGEKWRVVEERRRALERRRDVNAQLDFEEAEAELEALTGEERP